MSVKRYVAHMGAIIPIAEEDAGLTWKNFKKFVASEDYAFLQNDLKNLEAENLMFRQKNAEMEAAMQTVAECSACPVCAEIAESSLKS